ncbi:MAG: carbamoyltransferase HypF, partial [Candidatus Sumerlaeota bacterium]
GKAVEGEALERAATLLTEGRILAVRGIGGFQLACRADDNAAVELLRRRKARETKPFALMARSFAHVREIVDCGADGSIFFEHARRLLSSPASPIVLLPRRDNVRVAPGVAPGNAALGVMLPYTPLHHLLLEQGPALLVMTSGNPSSEPLCADNDEALERLSHIADYFLLHDRDIERRVDDSVLIALAPEHSPDKEQPWTLPLRRARGYVPAPLPLKSAAREMGEVLAFGGDLKSAICLTRRGEALMSEHLGELENPASYRNFVHTVDKFLQFFDVEPCAVAIDLHPGYLSSKYGRCWARAHGCDVVPVQHHHAHLAGGLVEYGIEDEMVVAITADGTGYGSDGAVWGGEILVGNAAGFERIAHIGYYDLPGGDLAARQTWRPAAALLHCIYGTEWKEIVDWKTKGVNREVLEILDKRFTSDEAPQSPTSSTGRLFDAAAFLLGFCNENLNEAQAPMALESAAMESEKPDWCIGTETLLKKTEEETFLLNPLAVFEKIVAGLQNGEDRCVLARFFHEALATMLAEGAIEAVRRKNLGRVVLSGGCFANRLMIGSVSRKLRKAGLEVLAHRLVPTGDGGLALGQAAIAAAAISQGE